MRPITLYLEGFGQYLAPQTVPLDRMDPVFLIAGETGAGKTTLFDAISYALYGAGLGSRQEASLLRSQLAGPQDSTIVRFRFAVRGEEWEVERSPYKFTRMKRSGNADSEKYATLTRLTGAGAPERVTPSEVDRRVVDLIGLEHKDFSKILVLPQGEFQRFLEMESADRAKILKTLFPVERHEDVASMAARRSQQVHADADALDAVIAELRRGWNEATFAADERALLDDVAALTQAESSAGEARRAAEAALHAARELARDLEALAAREADRERHLATQGGQAARRARQDAAQRATAALPAVTELERRRADLDAAEGRLVVALRADAAATAALEALAPARAGLGERTKALAEADEELRALERRIAELRLLRGAQERLRLLREAAATAQGAAIGAAEQLEAAEAAVAALDEVAAAREAARPALGAAEEALARCRAAERDALAVAAWHGRRAPELEGQLGTEGAALAEQQRRLDDAAADLEDAQRRLREDAALLVAASLRPGEPCPACGSPAHPAPRTGARGREDAVQAVRVAEKALDAQRRLLDGARERVTKLEERRATELQAAERAANLLADAGYSDPAAWRAGLAAATAAVTPLRAQDQAATAELARRPVLVKARDARRAALEAARQAAQRADSEVTAAETAVQGHVERVGQTEDLAGELDRCEARRADGAARNEAERRAVEKLQRDGQAADVSAAKAREALEGATRLRDGQRSLLPAAEAEAERALREAAFATAAEARGAALPPDELTRLQRQLKAWDDALAGLDASIGDLRAAVADRPAPDLAGLEQAAAEAGTAARTATESRVAKQKALDDLRERAARVHAKERELAELKARAGGLIELSKHLNGQVAPKIDFATWMLTWWLEQVLTRASARMRTLSDSRYAFVRRPQSGDGRKRSGLDIEVHDSWTNQQREAKALSGGEKFLASLSLALGLADVVQSQNGGVQLDTLFIDEGFGSLDATTLDRAMDLVNQVAEHRAVGLISHVEAMQKAIPSQIVVTKSPRGSTVRVVG